MQNKAIFSETANGSAHNPATSEKTFPLSIYMFTVAVISAKYRPITSFKTVPYQLYSALVLAVEDSAVPSIWESSQAVM